MRQYGEVYVNEFAPFLWDFTDCEVPNLGVRPHPVHVAMWNIATRRVFFGQFGDLQYRAVRQYVRRAIYAAKHYSAMRRLTVKYFGSSRRDRPNLEVYFDALSEAESCLLNLHIMNDAISAIGPSLIGQDTYQRVNHLANSIKHFGGQSKGTKNNPIMPIYFLNSGVSNGKFQIDFTDLHAVVRENISVTRAVINHKEKQP